MRWTIGIIHDLCSACGTPGEKSLISEPILTPDVRKSISSLIALCCAQPSSYKSCCYCNEEKSVITNSLQLTPPTPELHPLVRITVHVDPPLLVGQTPLGERRIINITGGHFTGE
ncbi:MAG: DUF3237 family protein, partial [Caldilineaceae bacterium]|nr:DUF3237 family protein [Caldilineaceae bacterium]